MAIVNMTSNQSRRDMSSVPPHGAESPSRLATDFPPIGQTLRIVPANLRSARGQYTGSCLVFAGDTFVKGFPTVSAAKRFIAAQSKVVA